MSLLAAGLGMMSGTSQFAGANIGKGALAGVQDYRDTQKQRAAELAAVDKEIGSGLYRKTVGDYYSANALSKDEKTKLGQANALALEEERVNKRLLTRENQIRDNVKSILKLDTIGNITDPDVLAKFEAAVAKAKLSDSVYNKYFKQAMGFDYGIPDLNVGDSKILDFNTITKPKK
jgi:hypothetical protein